MTLESVTLWDLNTQEIFYVKEFDPIGILTTVEDGYFRLE